MFLNKFVIIFLLFASHIICYAAPVASASRGKFGYRAEPIVGYEQVFRATPTPHTSSRVLYGVRLIVGQEKLALEGEYTKAEDTENYLVAPQKIVNKDDKFKIGARSMINLGSLFFVTIRAGGQATRNINETTTNGTTVVVENPMTYDPYAGAHAGIHFGKFFSVSAGSTMIFKDLSDLTKNDYQTTLSFSVGTD